MSPDVLIWVQGRATSAHLRSIIRQTYGNQASWPHDIKIMVLFFTGVSSNSSTHSQSLLEYEFELYRDIIQNNYIGKYECMCFYL